MRKQPERTARTRQKLVDAFWQLYVEKRIEKITVKEIADKAGVYRSTFYEYFSDLYEILEGIEDELSTDLQQTWSQLFHYRDLDSAVDAVLDFYERHGEQMAVLLGPGGDQSFYLRLTMQAKEVLCSNIDVDPNDSHLAMIFAILPNTIFSLLQHWYANRETVELKQVLTFGSQIIREGLLPTMRDLGVPF